MSNIFDKLCKKCKLSIDENLCKRYLCTWHQGVYCQLPKGHKGEHMAMAEGIDNAKLGEKQTKVEYTINWPSK